LYGVTRGSEASEAGKLSSIDGTDRPPLMERIVPSLPVAAQCVANGGPLSSCV
jgi:hypothetical protein